MIYYTVVESPIGPLMLVSNGTALTGLYMNLHKGIEVPKPDWTENAAAEPFSIAALELSEFFAGERQAFSVPLAPTGTDFQLKVWAQLRAIPFGATKTYGEIATAIGQPTASRAVGLANGKNPISIIVPCHRVIGANGTLTGYAGGVAKKQFLLDFESGSTLGL